MNTLDRMIWQIFTEVDTAHKTVRGDKARELSKVVESMDKADLFDVFVRPVGGDRVDEEKREWEQEEVSMKTTLLSCYLAYIAESYPAEDPE